MTRLEDIHAGTRMTGIAAAGVATIKIYGNIVKDPVYVQGFNFGQPGFAQTSSTFSMTGCWSMGRHPHEQNLSRPLQHSSIRLLQKSRRSNGELRNIADKKKRRPREGASGR